ncbi:frizzled-2 [Chrysoperla carnea]|uniref:frizzled-2 n=1 Tax=Chrysoperla carnea TaxID=189513 RepID=UPI001D076169|nr:frizzled-2 [Chrysoperla carnea]XP_044737683.1 frizzled-2 [Chrysoperla carnea]
MLLKTKRKTFSWQYYAAVCLILCAGNVLSEHGISSLSSSSNGGGLSGSGVGLLSPIEQTNQPRCEEITIPMCRGIGYNVTYMPNDLNHETQEEAGLEVHQFWPLVEINCSPDLKFFLCSIYAPICIEEYHKPLRSCRSVCERAKQGCEPIMEQYSFKWPERMNCNLFPVHGDSDQLCMDNKSESEAKAAPPRPTRRPISGSSGSTYCKGKNSKNCRDTPGEKINSAKGGSCACTCRNPLIPLGKESLLYNRSAVGNVANCAYPCKGAFFTTEEKEFANVWITLWSGLCAASTLMTLTTFLIDTERFKYPERPIIFLSACYFLVSCGYLVRVFMGHEEIACDGKSIKYSTTGPSSCTLVFLLVYFFGMASSIWWVVLSFTWFLAAGLKWGNEAISNYAQYFHLAAWLIPTIQTVAVILGQAVDGDPVSGICYVGNMNIEALRSYVLIPLLAYLLLGTTFLLAGFVSLFRIRSVIKRQGGAGAGTKADKLEKLMIRIGIFSVLYTVPATIVIGCYLYEAALHKEWLTSLTCPCRQRVKPLYSVVMLKYFMALAVGITSGVWIWSGKTLDSWRRFWRRLFGVNTRDQSGAAAVLIKPRPPPGYPILPPPSGSVASASQHHLHHHVLKQPPLSHV